jgi:hypothetical protein
LFSRFDKSFNEKQRAAFFAAFPSFGCGLKHGHVFVTSGILGFQLLFVNKKRTSVRILLMVMQYAWL